MCGRFLLTSSLDDLVAELHVDEVATEPLPPRYNVAPSTEIYAAIDREGSRRLGRLRWGFLPSWARSERGGRQPINARIETVATSRMFARSFAHRRCLIPADGFYEWQEREDGPKRPFHLAAEDGRPLVLAGIWTSWRDPEDPDREPVFSTAIVTTEARGAIAELHHRMPVILPERLWDDWAGTAAEDAPHLLDAVAALDAPELQATPIGTGVNNVRNDGPELLEPVGER
ncbi:MAG: SOS response-associated peptidase [Nitriliruptoraceae bacterium]